MDPRLTLSFELGLEVNTGGSIEKRTQNYCMTQNIHKVSSYSKNNEDGQIKSFPIRLNEMKNLYFGFVRVTFNLRGLAFNSVVKKVLVRRNLKKGSSYSKIPFFRYQYMLRLCAI